MPEIKLVVATCDEDHTQLECGGGYINESGNSIIVWYCPTCQGYYPAINGEFMGGKWSIVQAEDGIATHFKALTNNK